MKRVNDFEAAAPEIEVKARAPGGGKRAGGEGDEAAFFVAAEETNWFFQNSGGGKKKGLGVLGPAERAGGDGEGCLGLKSDDFALKLAQKGEGPATSGGQEATGESDPLAEANGVSFFVVKMKDGAFLFREKKFKSVGAEVEHGTAKRGSGHRLVKAVSGSDGKAFAESGRMSWE